MINFIDIHYHVNPDLYKRRHNALSAGKKYSKLKGAVLLISHLGSTVEVSSLAQEEYLPVLGSYVLNNIAGALNVKYVLSHLGKFKSFDDQTMLVSFPTNTGRRHISKLSRGLSSDFLRPVGLAPETVSRNNTLKSEAKEILKLALDYPISLSTGHASKEEVYLLAEYAYKIGLKKLLISQPANPLTGFDGKDLEKITNEFDFLWVEQTALTYLLGYQTWEDFSYVVKNVPRVIYSSDLGQTSMMDIEEWYNSSLKWFDKMNLSQAHIKLLMQTNPMNFLKI